MTHRQTQYGMAKGRLGSGVEEAEGGGEEPRTYSMEFPTRAGTRLCPVERCSGQALTWTVIMVHLWHRHIRDTMVILEEGNIPHPLCHLCDILVP